MEVARNVERSASVIALSFCLLLSLLVTCTSSTKSKLVPFEDSGRWGYRNAHGTVLIHPVYAYADSFLEGGIAAVVDDGGWAYVDTKGAVVIRPFVFDNGPDYFSEGVARYVAGEKIGFFDERGRIMIPARLDFAFPFHEGLAAMCEGCSRVREGEHTRIEGGKWGYIDRAGQVVIPPRFDFAFNFEGGKAEVQLGGRVVVIDREGNLVE